VVACAEPCMVSAPSMGHTVRPTGHPLHPSYILIATTKALLLFSLIA
jgi:hypothetical protein